MILYFRLFFPITEEQIYKVVGLNIIPLQKPKNKNDT